MEVRLENVRGAFLHLFEAKQVNGEGEAAYSGSFIFEKTSPNVKRLNDAIDGEARKKWLDKAPTMLKQLRAADKVCLHDGDLKTEYEGFPGHFFVSARNTSKPLVLDQKKSPLTKDDGKPYSGCFVNVVLDIWAQDNKFGKRVNASLKGVQFLRDGDAFSGSGPASPDAFEEVLEGADADDNDAAAKYA